ncbi:hypothetical protein ACQ4PT_029215 [Festuca glaucescens]
MAALLRHGAARRLGGSMVQRAQAAVAEERRRLGPRLIHTEEQAQEEITRKIQQKKEELYDVISMAQQSFWTSSSSNKRLLEHLAVQVNPRPEDHKWRRLCFSRRAKAVLDTVGYVAATGVVASVAVNVVVYFIKSYPKDRDAARAMIREEMREAREAKTRSGLKEH